MDEVFIEREMNLIKNAANDLLLSLNDEPRRIAILEFIARAFKLGETSKAQEIRKACSTGY